MSGALARPGRSRRATPSSSRSIFCASEFRRLHLPLLLPPILLGDLGDMGDWPGAATFSSSSSHTSRHYAVAAGSKSMRARRGVGSS